MAFVFILSFFREMLSCADKNKLTPEKISEILCECLVGEDKFNTCKGKETTAKGETPDGRAATDVLFGHTQRQRKLSPSRTLKERRVGTGSLAKGTTIVSNVGSGGANSGEDEEGEIEQE